MQARILSWFNRIIAKWKGLERGQKTKLILVAALVTLALGIGIYFLANPRMEVLVEARDPAHVTEITEALAAEGIQYQTLAQRISVRQADYEDARMVYTMLDSSVANEWTWDDALGSMSLTASARGIDQSIVNYYQARIQTNLMRVRGIDDASVILNLPQNSSYWMDSGQEPTAQVQITTNGVFSNSSGPNLARAVASSVVDLKLENVFIMDQNGAVVFSGELSENGQFSAQSELRAAFSAAWDRNVRNVLSPFGAQISVSANPLVDFSSLYEEAQRYYNPFDAETQAGLLASQNITEADAVGTDTPLEPGVAANDMATYLTAQGNGAMEQSFTQDDREYLHDVVRTITDSGNTGKVLHDESSISVAMVSFREFKEDAFGRGVYADVSNAATWEQFQEELSRPGYVMRDVNPMHVQAVQTATGLSADAVTLLDVERYVFIPTEVQGIDIREILMMAVMGLVIILLAYGLLKRYKPEEITELEPELSVEDLLVSTQIEEEKEHEFQEEERLREIKIQQDSETKQQIEKFINLRPEAAAQLLRNWLNEDWE